MRWFSLLLAALAFDAMAQPVLVVTTTPGGSPDTIARVLAPFVGAVVINIPGANGLAGTKHAADSARKTLVLLSESAIEDNPKIYPTAKEALERLTLVGVVAVSDGYLLVSKRAMSMNQLIADGKGRELTYSSPGVGSRHSRAAESFGKLAGLRLLHIPYQGGGAAVRAAVAGEVDFSFVGLGHARSMLSRLNALGGTWEGGMGRFHLIERGWVALYTNDVGSASELRKRLDLFRASPQVVDLLDSTGYRVARND